MGNKFSIIILILIFTVLTGCGSPEERAAEYLERAEELFEQEDYVTARIEAMNAAQIEPRNADVRYLLARIEEQDQDIRKAMGHLQVAVDADPNHLKSRIKLGNYYILARANEQAIEQAGAATELAPDNAEVLLLQARINFMNENNAMAMKLIDAALDKDPKLVGAIMFKAGLIMADGDVDKAIQLTQDGIDVADADGILQLRKFQILLLRTAERFDDIEVGLKALIADYPDDESFPLSLAQLYVIQKRFDEAEVIYKSYVEREPQDIPRRLEFVRFMGIQHGSESAKETLQGYIAELPESMELLLALGSLDEALEQLDEAFAIYEQVAVKEPKSPDGLKARNRMAVIKIRQNKVDEAKEIIDAILEDEQDNTDALLLRAAFSFTEKQYSEAVADLRMVIRERPDSQRALLLLARSHNAANNRELAQDAYRRLIEMNPAHPLASTELANLLSRSGDAPKAEEVLREQLAAAPDDRRAASTLIENLLQQGDIEAAELQARTMLDLEDETGLAEFQLGRVLQAKKSSQEAIDAYKDALKKNPRAPEPLQGLVSILVNADRSDEAVKFLRGHIEAYPEMLTPRLLLAAVYARQGENEAAAELYEEIILVEPKAIRAYASLSSLYPDDPEKRHEIYQRGIRANPKDPSIKLLLASDYEQAGEVDEAVIIYEQILEIDSNNIIAANNLAAIFLDFRSDAESHKRALDLSRRFSGTDQAALLDTLGWAYYRNGDYGNAIRILESAVANGGKIALLHYHLGMAFVKAEMTSRGREELELSLELAEESFTGIDEARETLAKL